jgi:hypothetical protein
MNIAFTSADVANWIADILRGEVTDTGDQFALTSRYFQSQALPPIPKSQIDTYISNLANCGISDETTIFSPHNFEVLVRDTSPGLGSIRLRDDRFEITDSEAGIHYTLAAPTTEYTIFLLSLMAGISRFSDFSRMVPISIFERRPSENRITDPFDAVKFLIFRQPSLQIESTEEISLSKFQQLSNSCLFHIAFNTDSALVPQRSIEELSRRSRISRNRRGTLAELDTPQRSYIDDLVYHYLLAVSTDNSLVEYLSFYHVIEHFFESVFNDDLVDRIKNHITLPSFSRKRKKDILSLVSLVSKSVKLRNEETTFSEPDALRLALQKYTRIPDLIFDLNEYDPTLISYYETTVVPFSDGDTVTFSGNDENDIYRKLTSRIYKTRNSLVHSKEGDKKRFMPFRDDKALARELPLIRFMAEQIILATSQVM